MKPPKTPDLLAAANAAARIEKLLIDPEPGLSTWHLFLATAVCDLLEGLDLDAFTLEQLRKDVEEKAAAK